MRSLRAESLLAGALVLAACRGPAHPADAPSLVLLADDAEVWAFEVALTGRLEGEGKLRSCAIDQGEVAHAAETDGRTITAKVPLRAGLNVLAARCLDARAHEHRSAPVRFTVPLRDVPRARARATVRAGKLVLDASESAPREGSDARLVTYAWSEAVGSLARTHEVALGDGVHLVLPAPSPGRHRYALRVRDERGHEERADVALDVTGGDARDDPSSAPPWLASAVVYGVIPKLYGDPPLARVTARLDEIAALGVDALWLSPIYASPPDDYGYAVTDFLRVREQLGSEADLAALTRAAHARGLRVLLDLVVNHSSDEHPYFRSARMRGERSHYAAFYERDAHGEPTHYFDWTHLPNLAFREPEVQAWVLAFSSHWLRAFDVDGYRIDAVWGVRERQPDFLPRFTAELSRVNPDAVLIAEASARDPYYVENGFHAAYDWTEQPGRHAWEHVFDGPSGIARRLADAVDQTARKTPHPARTMRFLNNNDTGARFITRHGEPLTRVATAALLTLPGIPCLFAFDEVGGELEPYVEAPPSLSTPRPGLRELHRQLIALRKASPALHAPGYLPLVRGEHDELLAFLRHDERTEDVALVALNFGATPIEAELALPAPFAVRLGKRLRDALDASVMPVRAGKLALTVPPFGARVLVPDGAKKRR